MLIALIFLYVLLQGALLVWAHRRKSVVKSARVKIFGALVAAVCWTFFINDSARVLSVAPLKYAVVLYNLVPLLMAWALSLLIALYARALSRSVILGIFLLAIDFHYWSGVFYSPVKSTVEWRGACCMQSTEYSCGAAAAATLLNARGIDAQEADMLKTCLTSFRGTSFWGLYHGLRDTADAHGKRVVVSDASFERFMERDRPALIFVMLTAELDAKDKRYSRDWHWVVNVAHAVVFLGATSGDRILMADPSFGIEPWNREGLRQLWRNRAIYIE